MKKKSRMPEIGEAVFCLFYLGFMAVAAVLFLKNGSKLASMFALLTGILAGGDAFHLVPRIIKAFKGDFETYDWWAGLGLLVSSVTMTVFYLYLLSIWREIFKETALPSVLLYGIWGTGLIRIVLCLFPQNNWFHHEGNLKWGLYRNIPFVIMGVMEMVLFVLPDNTFGLWKMAVAIFVSFLCYMPVVLWAKKNPKVGMLMMPKTMAYIWMICMGLAYVA